MNKLTMIGSSIFEHWGQPNWGSIKINNRAIGGTTTTFWLDHMREHVQADVTHLAFYCGSNDLNAGVDPNTIIDQTHRCFDILKTINPMIKIAYFSIMKAPQKYDKFAMIDAINSTIKNKLVPTDLFVNINALIDQDTKWYIDDGLHLQPATYHAMDVAFGKTIANWVT